MKTKLTLSVDKDLVAFAHAQAQARKQSVSSLFSAYLRAQKKARPTIEQVSGSLKQYHIDDSKPAIREAYAQKHLN